MHYVVCVAGRRYQTTEGLLQLNMDLHAEYVNIASSILWDESSVGFWNPLTIFLCTVRYGISKGVTQKQGALSKVIFIAALKGCTKQ